MQDDRWRKILQYCVYQERSQLEVRYKLVELGYRGDDVEEALALLISENFVNESRFASLYAISKLRNKEWGKNKIKIQLKQKGISPYTIKEAIATINDEEYQEILMRTALKYKRVHNLDISKYQHKYKIVNYLLQKGYERDEIDGIIIYLSNMK